MSSNNTVECGESTPKGALWGLMKCYMIFYEYHNLQSAKTRMTPKIWYTSMNKKMKYGCGFNSEGEGKVTVFSAKR